jgi:hypothetical protein
MATNKCIKCGKKETIFPEKINNWICSKCFAEYCKEDQENWIDLEE